MALISNEIALPTTIHGERVACVFPCVGGERHTQFVDAQVVTVSGEDEKGTAVVWSTYRFQPTSGEPRVVIGGEYTSFPAAIRAARQAQGWG